MLQSACGFILQSAIALIQKKCTWMYFKRAKLRDVTNYEEFRLYWKKKRQKTAIEEASNINSGRTF